MENPPKVIWQTGSSANVEQLYEDLSQLGRLLPDPLQERIDIREYAEKLAMYGHTASVISGGRTVGILAMYANDLTGGTAFISLVVIAEKFQSNGLGRRLLIEAEDLALKYEMKRLSLTVHRENVRAIRFYARLGFEEENASGDKVKMSKIISVNI